MAIPRSWSRLRFALFAAIVSLLGVAATHCSSQEDARNVFGSVTGGATATGGAGVNQGGVAVGFGGAGGASAGGLSIDVGGGPPGCKGLQCQTRVCQGTTTTTISGRVFDPSGTLPLYNVMVYVPNAPITPLKQGANCECEVNGEPMAAGLTDTNGKFVVQNAPVGANIPLVIQIGKWRRQFTIPMVTACADTVVPGEVLRLPARQSEGDMPKIALTTGGADALECLLRKIGIDAAEMTNPDGAGRIHLYAGHDGSNRYAAGMNSGAMFPSASTLWNTLPSLSQYDVVLLSCEGGEFLEEKTQGLKAMADYANLGGRVFASHWHQIWLKENPSFPYQIAQYTSQSDIQTIAAQVVTTFPKGRALSEWLVNVQATPTAGQIDISNVQHTIVRENPLYAQRWIASTTPAAVQYLSANTPLGAEVSKQCGRMVLSDLHVAGGASAAGGTDTSSPALPYPMGCVTSGLSPQEKVLVFMLFDISACLIPDTKQPEPPVVK